VNTTAHSPETFGYTLYPSRRPSEVGYSRLDVTFRAQPTGLHFDPEALRLTVAAPQGGLDSLKVAHPWVGERHYQACAGQVDLSDRLDKKVEAFTFGGELSIASFGEETCASLQSAAPLLLCRSLESVPSMLAQESEILLAERRAAWSHAPQVFEQRMVNAAPLVLYQACLHAILRRFEHFPNPGEEIVHFVHVLRAELTALRDDGLGEPPALDQIL